MDKLREIVFCTMMLGTCLYLWYVEKRIDTILDEIRELLEGDDEEHDETASSRNVAFAGIFKGNCKLAAG